MSTFSFDSLARINPTAVNCEADIRQQAEFFQVNEMLPFTPDEVGGHVMLLIQKKDTNTDWLAKQLAIFAGVPELDIGYAGLKDRHAVTTQWFTVKVEGVTEPDWHQFDGDNWQVKSIHRHNKKLKRGVLSGNHFTLVLSNLKGSKEDWEQHLQNISTHGVPNYFAEQRFGRQLANLHRADHWITGGRAPKKRQQKSLYLSAARSWLFNQVLSERVKQGNWNQFIAGDVMQLAGSHSCFTPDRDDSEITHRLDSFDIHPTGPLWGRGTSLAQSDALALEQQVLHGWEDWRAGLERAGLKQERRALRVVPQEFSWQFENDKLLLSFFLPAGSYATAVMRELASIHDVSELNPVDKSLVTESQA